MSYGSPNPYQSPANSFPLAASASELERSAFIQRTYAHVAGAAAAFVAIEAAWFTLVPEATLLRFTQLAFSGWNWLIVLGAFMVVGWLARSWASSSTSSGLQYLGLGLYVVAESIIFLPLLAYAQYAIGDKYLIPSAGLITLITFGGLTAVVFFTKADFSFLRMYLWWGGIAALGLIVASMIFGFSLGIVFSVAMIALMSGYILYDTSNVLHHYHTDQHVAAALALFASLAVLFWYVIQLLMALSGRD